MQQHCFNWWTFQCSCTCYERIDPIIDVMYVYTVSTDVVVSCGILPEDNCVHMWRHWHYGQKIIKTCVGWQ